MKCLFFGLLLCSLAVNAQQMKEYNIENEAVSYYTTHSTSTFSAVEGSVKQDFFDAARPYRADWPQPIVIDTQAEPAYSGTTIVTLSQQRNMKHPVATLASTLNEGKGKVRFVNLIPGKTYYYQVKTTDGRLVASDCFRTTGQVRMIAIGKGFNIRDLGGWKGLDGMTIRYGWLYRGGSLGGTDKTGKESSLPDADRTTLKNLGIKAQLDLRAATDKGKYAGEWSLHSYSAGHTPIPQASFQNTMTDYGAYNEDASVVSDMAWIIQQLKQGKPVYFNCRQGADRTGTIAFVIEGLLGCYDHTNQAGGNQMAIDYELTGFSQANLVDNIKVTTSHRPATEAYQNRHKLFRQLIDLDASHDGITLTNLQQRIYYYLNRYFKTSAKPTNAAPIAIDACDLDWFIKHMLGMKQKQYAPHAPSWRFKGDKLNAICE